MPKLFFACFLVCFAFVNHSSASDIKVDSDLFAIKDIQVNEVSFSAESAKEKALKYAKKRAFQMMIKNFFDKSDAKDPAFEQIDALVQAIEVKNEAVSDKRYQALVTISFDPEQTQFFLKNNFLNKPVKKLSVLIIPVFTENGLKKLWQNGNLWLESWRLTKARVDIDFKVPIGDIDDVAKFKLENLDKISASQAKELARFYKVEKILIAEIDDSYQITSDVENYKVFLRSLSNQENLAVIAESQGEKNEDKRKHFDYLINVTLTSLSSGWLAQNEDSRQEFVVRIKNIADWMEIKNRIGDLDIVKSYKVTSFAARYATIEIQFVKKPIQVFDLMRDLGFTVNHINGLVILETRE